VMTRMVTEKGRFERVVGGDEWGVEGFMFGMDCFEAGDKNLRSM